MDLELPLSDGEDLLSFDFELEEEEEDLDPDVGVEGRLLGLSLLPLSLDLKQSNVCHYDCLRVLKCKTIFVIHI